MVTNQTKDVKGKILIVDDRPETLENLSNTLYQQGYLVQRVIDGEMALRIVESEPPDLILLDIVMPVMDGYQVCQALKAQAETREIPIIFLSILDKGFDKVRAFNSGGIDYITKPFYLEEVIARIEHHLSWCREQKTLQEENQQLQRDLRSCLLAEADLSRAYQELERLASLDSLTQIANRRRFDEYIQQEWRRSMRSGEPLSLILGDVDYFKEYNDTYGHQAGDTCLQLIARAMERVLKRPADLVARYGGEEFAVILPNTNMTGALYIGETIKAEIALMAIAHFNSPINNFVTISFGVATMPASGDFSPEALIATADLALYQAKHQGRDRIVAYNS